MNFSQRQNISSCVGVYLTLLYEHPVLKQGRKEVAEKKSLRDWVVCGGGRVTPHIEKK